jgi:hypothetical protein
MSKIIIFATAIAAALTLSESGTAFAAGGHGGGGGGARGGGMRGGMRTRSAAPGMATPRGHAGGPPLGIARPRAGGGPVAPYDGGRGGWPYYGYGYGMFGGALGLGLYDYYDPLWYGPSAYAYPFGNVYPYPSGDPYAVPDDGTGRLRLDVTPKSAEVVVDGQLAGIVSDFNGRSHHLDLPAGAHHIEVREPGYASVQFDVNIEPDHTITYHGTLAKP